MKWRQELLWVKRDERGVILRIEEKLPENADFVPIIKRQSADRGRSRQADEKTQNKTRWGFYFNTMSGKE